MFLALIGSRCSGKSTIQNYLITKGFIPVRIDDQGVRKHEVHTIPGGETTQALHPEVHRLSTSTSSQEVLHFANTDELLQHVTKHWRSHFVTTDLRTRMVIKKFVRRPFFMLMNVDAPLLERFHRHKQYASCFLSHFTNAVMLLKPLSHRVHVCSLEDFVHEQDLHLFGQPGNTYQSPSPNESPLLSLNDLVNLHIINSFPSVRELHSYLDALNLLDPAHLRPTWDAYFMTLASLASHRSNCMKRRVGAVLVRDHRIVATGYNGTPRGVLNCNEGGCAHCNGTFNPEAPLECVCLHAEENALLEAGRDRVGRGATLYCNTCPCLKCTVKIIQTGVKEVVYNLSYKVDEASGKLFKEAGVELRQYIPKSITYLSTSETHEGLSLQIPNIKLADS